MTDAERFWARVDNPLDQLPGRRGCRTCIEASERRRHRARRLRYRILIDAGVPYEVTRRARMTYAAARAALERAA